MTTRFFSLILLFFTIAGTAQNLVPNHSFEEFEDGCPETFNGTVAHGWERWANSPDLFSTCVDPQSFNDSLGWVPWNGFGYQWPFEGDSYAGLYAHGQVGDDWSENYREYIGCELLEPLEEGITYYVSFNVSSGIIGSYYWITTACNGLGAYFTTQGFHYENNPLEIPNEAHVYTDNIISDTLNWVTIAGSFTADQPYTHMGLGVFFDFDLLEVVETNPHPQGGLGSYYYIDDVCVSPYPDCNSYTSSSRIQNQEQIVVYPNPAANSVILESNRVMERVGLLDGSGKWIVSREQVRTDRLKWDISEIPSGMYIFYIETTTGVKREKLMVVR